MLYIRLFFSFAKIGFTSFGGMSMIPLIMEEMQERGWMSMEDLANLVAIAEMTPGPLGLNCATFAGNQTGGILGGLAAVAGVLMPAYTLTLLAAIFYAKMKKSKWLEAIMSTVKPICIAMIVTVVLTLSRNTYLEGRKADWISLGIGILMLFLIGKKKWSVPKVIGTAALLGIVCSFF